MIPLEWKGNLLKVLDQRALPEQELYIECKSMEDVSAAIQTLAVRGAPTIGVAAAYGMVLAYIDLIKKNPVTLPLPIDYNHYTKPLLYSRPTAVNLQWAVGRMLHYYDNVVFSQTANIKSSIELLLNEAKAIHRKDILLNQAIATNGADLFSSNVTLLTHCNAGSLATTGVGTALGIVRELWKRGQLSHLFIDETRPLLQGARLTAYEMQKEGIPSTLICDNMAATVIRDKFVNGIIVGADRIALNGDVANKIGTYGLAILANYHKIPFWVAAPSTTFDFSLSSGKYIKIEERDPIEVRRFGQLWSTTKNMPVFNPAFDVTPADLVTGIITEKGVLKPPFNKSISLFKRSVKDEANY